MSIIPLNAGMRLKNSINFVMAPRQRHDVTATRCRFCLPFANHHIESCSCLWCGSVRAHTEMQYKIRCSFTHELCSQDKDGTLPHPHGGINVSRRPDASARRKNWCYTYTCIRTCRYRGNIMPWACCCAADVCKTFLVGVSILTLATCGLRSEYYFSFPQRVLLFFFE